MASGGGVDGAAGAAGGAGAADDALPHHKVDERLLGPLQYLLQIPGKNVRGMLTACFQKWLKIPEEKLEAITQIITYLHTASLLVDDIEDGSELRRGVPVAHKIFGVPMVINSANYVYFLALEKCHALGNSRALSVFCEELLDLHRGQGQDIMWRDAGTCPTEEQYRQMVIDKTGGLFRLAVRLMQCFAEPGSKAAELELMPLTNTLALYFQIRDDYINLDSAAYMQNKSFCEDLTEGKFSFLIIHAVHTRPRDRRLLSILKQRTDDAAVKAYAVSYLKACGSFEYARNALRELKAQVEGQIEALGGHPQLLALVNTLDKQLDDGAAVADAADLAAAVDSAQHGGGLPPVSPIHGDDGREIPLPSLPAAAAAGVAWASATGNPALAALVESGEGGDQRGAVVSAALAAAAAGEADEELDVAGDAPLAPPQPSRSRSTSGRLVRVRYDSL